jgi:hypothetical protein
VVGLTVASQALACGESSTGGHVPTGNGGTGGESSGGSTSGSTATGGGGASGGSVATSGNGGSGGSLATGGGGATGGAITRAGSAGASAGSPTAGSAGASAGSPGGGTGGKSNYGNPLPPDARCDAFAMRVVAACPGEWTYDASHAFCQEGLNQFYPIGCEPEFDSLIVCDGEIDCDAGFSPRCAGAHTECHNTFVQETECVREGAGVTCPEGSYAFVCRSDPPASCTPTEALGSAWRACCPPFETAR